MNNPSPIEGFHPDQRFLNQLVIASRLWSDDYAEADQLMHEIATVYDLELPPGCDDWPDVDIQTDQVVWPNEMVEWMRQHGGF